MTHKSYITEQLVQFIACDGLDWRSARSKLLRSNHRLRSSDMPTDEEIEHALREYYAIFCPKEHAETLKTLRSLALSWMERFESFSPRLIRGVLNGCADRFSNICLEIVAEDLKSFEIFLLDHDVEYEVISNPLQNRRDFSETIFFPTTTLIRGKTNEINVVVSVYEYLPIKPKKGKKPDSYQHPLETLSSATIKELKELINAIDLQNIR